MFEQVAKLNGKIDTESVRDLAVGKKIRCNVINRKRSLKMIETFLIKN